MTARLARLLVTLAALSWLLTGAAAAAGSPGAPGVRPQSILRSLTPTVAHFRAGTHPAAARLRVRQQTMSETYPQPPPGTGPALPLYYFGGAAQVWGLNWYDIYWRPAGFPFPAGYEALIDQYWTDVAADSGKNTSGWAVATYLYDTILGYQRPFNYNEVYQGSVPTADPFPPNGCSQPAISAVCLTMAQVNGQIAAVIAAMGWPVQNNRAYNMYLPPNVSVCTDGSNSSCSVVNLCSIHEGVIINNQITYADIFPDAAWARNTLPNSCAPFIGYQPNGNDADNTINFAQAEGLQQATDPNDDAWLIADRSREGSDDCAWWFPPNLPTAANGNYYDETINSHQYMAEEFYNINQGACTITK